MNAPPIVARELLVRARQGRTQWTRLGVSAMAVLFSLQFLVLWGGTTVSLAQLSGYAFQCLAWMGFLLACAGCLLTADGLSGERRGGTLGLLLLTRVGVGEVVLGKLTAHGLAAVLGLVGLTPTLMLPVLAGGVTWRQVLWTAVAWLAMLWFSLCLGLWASGKSWSQSQSLKRAAAGFGLLVILPLVLGSLQIQAGATELGGAVRCLSPATAFLESVVIGATSPFPTLIGSITVSGVLGLSFLILAGRELKRSYANSGVEYSMGNAPAERQRSVNPPSDLPPVEWLLTRDRVQTRVLWLAAMLGALMPVLNFVLPRFGGISLVGVLSSVYFLGGFGSAMLFAVAGMRFLGAARSNGGLELLCTTPVGASSFIPGAWRVLRRRLIGPLLVLVVLNLIGNLRWLTQPMGMSGPSGIALLLRIVLGPVAIITNAVALGWLGMWFGLRARTALSTVLWPVGLVWGLDLILSFVFQILYAVYASQFGGGLGSAWGYSRLLVVPLLCIGKQIWLMRWASRQLHNDLSVHGWEPFGVRSLWRAMMDRVRKVRHWTGGGT